MGTIGKIKGLGEVALRVSDLDAMVEFYRSVIGLPLIRQNKVFAFIKLAEGFEGHTQVLALFDRSASKPDPPNGKSSTLDHIAFNVSLSDFESERVRLESLGCDVMLSEHGWVQWRSLYVTDPEGNTVEFVCFDESIPKEEYV